jgi:HlyD family secretion protein
MDRIRKHRIAVFGVCAILALGVGWHFLTQPEEQGVTATVETGDVIASVTVSGVARATEAARLRFPDAGRIADILVAKGDGVKKGDVLALLDAGDLDADRREAMAGLSRALASRDELVQGPTTEAREEISITVENARANLERVRTEEAEKVASARRTLLGSDLALVPEILDSNDVPPTIGGTYTCDEAGTYQIEIYRSGALSGYSYRVTGLEKGTYSAYVDQAGAFGECGLTLQLDADESYRNMTWTLAIPNTRGASYLANQNALALAEERERAAIDAASDALTAALAAETEDIADPRTEVLKKADADIDAALARVARVDALRERRILRSPFDGTVTDIVPEIGEVTPANEPAITLVSNNAFEVIARIPEIDITKVSESNPATLVFDAKDSERIPASVAFLSPLASPVDGVAYFDATIALDVVPEWVREGLNADVEIVIDAERGVPRIPRRFLYERDGTTYALVRENGIDTERKVTIGTVGTDGYAAVDLAPGTVVVAP